ncbi:MAG: glycosyltransferase family 4 protein, partial [Candidatus Brocadiaceae bacterium]
MPAPVLHCYADYKWTGPSGPVARLCRRLTGRGWRSDLACIEPPDRAGRSLGQRARAMGLRAFESFYFDSDPNLWRNARDIRRLRTLIEDGDYALVHCHGTWDQVLASLALRGRRAQTPLVRTDHRARSYLRNPLWRLYYGPRIIDHLLVLSDRCAARAVDLMGLPPGFVTTVPGAVDTESFRPLSPPPDLRPRLGLREEDIVFGVVARVQRHRRFEVLLAAALIVKRRDSRVRIAVCGRGTHKEEVLDRPVVRLGLEDTVLALGYRRDDYKEVLATFDAGVMLVPGSDGSCRAAMEIAAMGTPLIVARRGTLPDIVRDGETGIVVEDTPENLAEAMLEMATDPERRR